MYHFAITDSGFGGLSICAFISNYIKKEIKKGKYKITFVNAAPSNELGYNSMPLKKHKIENFNRVLQGINRHYSPDYLFVACNSLSAILKETSFYQSSKFPIEGIIDSGISLIYESLLLENDSCVIIFATETTIEEQNYQLALEKLGIEKTKIISQPCPGLATMISNDKTGNQVFSAICGFVKEALKKISNKKNKVISFLGCTHYGYRSIYFEKAFQEQNRTTQLINPNFSLPLHIKSLHHSDESSLSILVEFVSRYELPKNEVNTIQNFINPISPIVSEALANYTLMPNLFDIK